MPHRRWRIPQMDYLCVLGGHVLAHANRPRAPALWASAFAGASGFARTIKPLVVYVLAAREVEKIDADTTGFFPHYRAHSECAAKIVYLGDARFSGGG